MWQDQMIPMMRAVISDWEPDVSYSDDRLEILLIVAAKYVNMEMDFDYEINIEVPSISPDPVTSEDDAFINFVVLKAACIVDQGNLRVKAGLAGVKARAGPAQMEIDSRYAQNYLAIIDKGSCALYDKLKWEYQLGNRPIAKCILNAFISNNYSPSGVIGGRIGREEAMFF